MSFGRGCFFLAVGYVGGMLIYSVDTILQAIGKAIAYLIVYAYFR